MDAKFLGERVHSGLDGWVAVLALCFSIRFPVVSLSNACKSWVRGPQLLHHTVWTAQYSTRPYSTMQHITVHHCFVYHPFAHIFTPHSLQCIVSGPPPPGDEYTKTCPPKKVDVMQAAVLEFRDRPDKPLYCVEHMIEGDYVSDES
jgi:hypothetical protein